MNVVLIEFSIVSLMWRYFTTVSVYIRRQIWCKMLVAERYILLEQNVKQTHAFLLLSTVCSKSSESLRRPVQCCTCIIPCSSTFHDLFILCNHALRKHGWCLALESLLKNCISFPTTCLHSGIDFSDLRARSSHQAAILRPGKLSPPLHHRRPSAAFPAAVSSLSPFSNCLLPLLSPLSPFHSFQPFSRCIFAALSVLLSVKTREYAMVVAKRLDRIIVI